MDLICYLHPGWRPLIRPAPATRRWMSDSPEGFAYRCLPLNIANSHGWEVLSPCGFEAVWSGAPNADGVSITLDPASDVQRAPVALFGQGVITFHVEGILRTPPGWNLWVGGPPNRQKDGIAPLTGVIETDWSPFTFTMNWRFTRPGQIVRFEALEPIATFFPVQRGAVEAFAPRYEPLDADPATQARFLEWSAARDAFQANVRDNPPRRPSDHWQKHYYRGVDTSGEALISDHQAKLRPRAFDAAAAPQIPALPVEDSFPETPAAQRPSGAPSRDESVSLKTLRRDLAKREWLLELMERQRELCPDIARIERRADLSADEFLQRYYAPSRPVILTGEMAAWPALSLWTPEYLKAKIGDAPISYQGARTANPLFEMEKGIHKRQAPFGDFIDQITRADGNDAYLTAYNAPDNIAALAPLEADLGILDKFLTPNRGAGMMWIGPGGTFTSLHHDLTNNFIAQLVGRKKILLIPAGEVGKLRNYRHVFSEIPDLEAPGLNFAADLRLASTRAYHLEIAAGEILFIPIGWWHQVRSLEFSVTSTYTNFRWPNDGHIGYPAD